MPIVRSTLALALLMGSAHAVLAQQSAVAQSVPTSPPSPVNSVTPGANVPPSSGIGEIIVTAQRRSENVQKVPISITAISAVKLQAANITTTADLAAVTPALTFSESNGNLEPRIRGLGNSSAGPSVENSIATYIDGVYISSSPGSLLSLENVQRIEVLDGPQGTLFGRNATGGLIQIVTKDPKSTFSGNADISYESYDTTRLGAYVTGPIMDGLDADLAIYASHQGDGYGTDVANDKPTYKTDRDLSLRSKWLAHIGSDTTLHVNFDFSNSSSSDPAFTQPDGLQPTYVPNSPAAQAALKNNRYDDNANNQPERRLLAGGVSGRLDQVVGPITLTDIVAYRRTNFEFVFDADGTPIQHIEQMAKQQDEEVTEEFQISPTHSGRLQWIVGAYYYHLDSGYTPLETLVGAPPAQTGTVALPTFTTESVAGYAQATYELLPQTHVTAGFRYTNENRDEGGTQGTISAAGLETLKPITPASTQTNSPTWRLALDHQFGDILGYVSWNRGFKSGGFNPTVVSQPPYKAERLDDYEIGEKATLLDGRLRLNAALFYYVYKNIQVNTFLNSLAVIYNGAEAREYGLDATFDYSISNDLSLTGGVTALHDRFTSFPDAVLATINPNGTVSTHQGSASGNRLPFAPDATVSLGVDYKRTIANGRADLFINDLYNTGYYGQVDNVLHQGAYHMLNASLQFQPDASSLTFKLYARNITNAAVAELLSVSSTGPAASYEAPATYGFTVGVKF